MKLHYPLYNEAGASDAGGGNPNPMDSGDDGFSAALAEGIQSFNQSGDVGKVNADGSQPEQPKEAPKQEVKQPEKPVEQAKTTEKKKLTDKLSGLEEDKAEETTDEAEEEIPATKDGQQHTEKELSRWKQLKQAEKWQKEYEPKIKEYEQKIAELQKSAIPDDVKAELEELRQHRNVFDVRNSPEYKDTVETPLNNIGTEISEISKEFNLDEGKLWNAMREITGWKRNAAVAGVIRASKAAAVAKADEDGVEYDASKEMPQEVVSSVLDAANRAHSVWKKAADIESKAGEAMAAKKAEMGQKQQTSTAEQEAAWQKHIDAGIEVISKHMSPIIKNMDEKAKAEFMNAIKTAKISDDPEERAFQAQSPQVLAMMVDGINKKSLENAALKKEIAALLKTAPKTQQDRGEVVKKQGKPGDDFDEFEDELSSAIKSGGFR